MIFDAPEFSILPCPHNPERMRAENLLTLLELLQYAAELEALEEEGLL